MRAEYLRNILDYNPETGHLTWKRDTAHLLRGNTARKGKRAGVSGQVSINGQSYGTHIIAWIIHYGERPISMIQFADGDKKNTKLENMFDSGSTTRKLCTVCKKSGGADLFAKSVGTKSGLTSECKVCFNNKYRRKKAKEETKLPPMFMPPIVQRSLEQTKPRHRNG